MRFQLFAIHLIVLGYRWALVLAEQDERSPLCLKLEEEGHLTRDQANTTVGPWAQRQYDEWKESGADGQFWHWLHKRWAPDVADSILECDISKTCSPVTCRLIDDRHDLQDQWNAYWTLESTAIFHNMAYEIRDANLQAWTSVRGELGTLVAKFSDGSNIEAHKAQHDRQWKIASHVICGVALTITCVGTFVSAAIGVGLGMSTAVKEALMQNQVPEQVRMISSSAGLFSTGATTALSFGTDLMGVKEYVSKMENLLEASQKQNQDRVVDRFDAYMEGLFSGTDPSLVQYVKLGGYANSTRVLTPKHIEELKARWAASYISSI